MSDVSLEGMSSDSEQIPVSEVSTNGESTDNVNAAVNEPDEDEGYDRANVNRIKKIILATIIVLILIPIILCIVLFVRVRKLEKTLDKYISSIEQQDSTMKASLDGVQSDFEEKKAEQRLLNEEKAQEIADRRSMLEEKIQDVVKSDTAKLDDDAVVETDTEHSDILLMNKDGDLKESKYNGHKVYLTFDDGPGPYTNEILDILKEKNVKATFFVVANDYTYADELKRIVEEGHTLALHSMSHKYDVIYSSLDAFKADVQGLHDLIFDITGVDCKYYRFPGGSSNTVSTVPMKDCISYLNESGYIYFDWNALNGDAEYVSYSKQELNDNVLYYVRSNPGNSTVLLHDQQNHYTTVEALPELIDTLQEERYELLPITDDTKPTQHVTLEDLNQTTESEKE